jgi:signal transduction histidine kinase
LNTKRTRPARRPSPWRSRTAWWVFTAAVLVLVWLAAPLAQLLDAQALALLQRALPGRPAAQTAAITFDARATERLTQGRAWGGALAALLRRLSDAGVKAVWLLAPPELTPDERQAIGRAAGRLALYVDQVAGPDLPAQPLEWLPVEGWRGESITFGARVRLASGSSDLVRVPLSASVVDGPMVDLNAWRMAGSPRLATLMDAPRGVFGQSIPEHFTPLVPMHLATVQGVVAPRLGESGSALLFDGMAVVLGAESLGQQLTGKLVVVGWDDPRTRAIVPGESSRVGLPHFWALVTDAFAAEAFIIWINRSIVNAGTMALLLLAALLIATGPPRRGVVGISALVVGVCAISLSSYALAGIFVPLASFSIGLALLGIGWAVGRMRRSARYFKRQLAILDSQLQQGGWQGGARRAHDSIAVVEEAVEQLQAQRAFVLDLVDSLPIGVLAADVNGIVQLANRRASDWLRIEPPSPAPAPAMALRDVLMTLRSRGGTAADLLWQREANCEALARDDRPVWVQYRHIGGPLPSIVAIADMSKFKAEAAMKQQALDFLSHDMRAPLSSIAAIVQTPLADQQTRTVDETLSLIGRLAYRTLDLANEFLALVRADETDTTKFEPVFLPDLLETIGEEFAPRARAAGSPLRITPGIDPVWVSGDVSLLARAIRNLVDNALRHGNGHEVGLALQTRNGKALVIVTDWGQGFDPAQLANLMAKSSAQGFGLGLQFVRRVAAAHGGTLTLANGSAGGALVTLALPQMLELPAAALSPATQEVISAR